MKVEEEKLVGKGKVERKDEGSEEEGRKGIEEEKEYVKGKGILLGVGFRERVIWVKVIERVEEMGEEGRRMEDCVGG